MRLPFVIRSRRADEKIARSAERDREENRTLKRAVGKLGHRQRQTLLDAARVVEDLRLIRVHIDRQMRPGSGTLRYMFEIEDRVILEGFRRDGFLHAMLASHIEEMFLRDHELREAVGL